MNSRAKGCRGEREFRDVLREAGFLKAYRTQQYSGKTGQACDVTCPELPSIHWEVKRVEAGNPYTWMEQAWFDSKSACGARNLMPVVAHKKNGKRWLAVLALDDLITLLKETDRVK
jgi:Holliday junction resolvase